MRLESTNSFEECSCDEGESSCCSTNINLENLNDQINLLESNKEKNCFALELQNQILQQILFLQQNSCNDSIIIEDNVLEKQKLLFEQLEEKINYLSENMTEQKELHNNEIKDIQEKMNKQLELYEKQVEKFEEKIFKNNFENLKEISSLQKEFLAKNLEENKIKLNNTKLLQQFEEKIKKINCDNFNEFSDIRKNIQIQFEKITTNNNYLNINEINSLKKSIKENFNKLIILQGQIEILKNNRDLCECVDEIESSIFDKNDKLLNINFDNLKKENCERASYIKLENRWGYITDIYGIKQKLVIYDNKFTSDFGTININDNIVEYKPSNKGISTNNLIKVYAQYKISKYFGDLSCYSLFYFEIKFIKNTNIHNREKKDLASIGVDSIPNFITFSSINKNKTTKYICIKSSKYGRINFPGKSFEDGDICGCGVVFPPKKLKNKKPYIFFTINGILFGKAIILELNPNYLFRPFFGVHTCIVESNFGENLENKPFIYNINKHINPELFFEEKDFSLFV